MSLDGKRQSYDHDSGPNASSIVLRSASYQDFNSGRHRTHIEVEICSFCNGRTLPLREFGSDCISMRKWEEHQTMLDRQFYTYMNPNDHVATMSLTNRTLTKVFEFIVSCDQKSSFSSPMRRLRPSKKKIRFAPLSIILHATMGTT